MSMRERALNYPYDAPSGGFMIRDGFCVSLPDDCDFSKRVAVLSVGSNRAPVQLFRKFGERQNILVTPVRVLDCDIVHIANLAGYGAVPCAAFPSTGTQIILNIAWLTAAQLEVMHATESLGDAYDFVRWDLAFIEHLHPKPLENLFGYASRKGALVTPEAVAGKNGPFALEAISAQDRQFQIWDQKTALHSIFNQSSTLLDSGSQGDFDTWLERIQSDDTFRLAHARHLAAQAIMPQSCPWQTVPPEIQNWFSPAGDALKIQQ